MFPYAELNSIYSNPDFSTKFNCYSSYRAVVVAAAFALPTGRLFDAFAVRCSPSLSLSLRARLATLFLHSTVEIVRRANIRHSNRSSVGSFILSLAQSMLTLSLTHFGAFILRQNKRSQQKFCYKTQAGSRSPGSVGHLQPVSSISSYR